MNPVGRAPEFRQRDGPRAVVTLVSGGQFVSHFYILAFPPLFPLLAEEFGLSNTELGAIVSAILLPSSSCRSPSASSSTGSAPSPCSSSASSSRRRASSSRAWPAWGTRCSPRSPWPRFTGTGGRRRAAGPAPAGLRPAASVSGPARQPARARRPTGRSFGFVFTGGSLGEFAAPLVLGGVIDLRSPAAAFAVIGGSFVVCVAIALGLRLGPRWSG